MLLTRLFVRKHVCMGARTHIHTYSPQAHYKLGAGGMTVRTIYTIFGMHKQTHNISTDMAKL
jgi:hypothetical protein